ncbi:hypothetical protein FISHEDRAFT_33974 [Fistulina hepatica ATCC 64428]|uniref:Reverse transcriptase zinc-binding domain-containing protein n=1 Tax=Fistulina hepatica ATCC 64428 TaxID=1128425 RepID=A0A0D7AMU4_9AGAR|nr:hypothetical protein FISHEDRAFT_33974 [Fistulina hepatica ATCC 64428]
MDEKNGEVLKRIVNALRQRSAPTYFQRALVSELNMRKAQRLAKEGASKIEENVFPLHGALNFCPPGAKLAKMTIKRAYREIRRRKPKPQRKKTLDNLKKCRETVKLAQQTQPSDETIWKSLSDNDITNKQSVFLWKIIHDAFKTGRYWSHIPTFEDRGECPVCRETEDLDHILFKCKIPGQEIVWDLVKEIFMKKGIKWPDLSLFSLMVLGLLDFKNSRDMLLEGAQRLAKIVIIESIHIIWALRCERRIQFQDNERSWRSNQYIRNLWISSINSRIAIDRLSTNRRKFGSRAVKKETVLKTWSGILQNEDALPDNWIFGPRVLVGISANRRPRGRNRQ